jgi:hypothetical protein
MKQIKILAALFLIVILASCNQGGSTSINDGGGSFGMWTIPGVGTKYILEYTQSDTSATEFDTITVIKTGQHRGGKTNVVSFFSSDNGNNDTSFYNIEQNGDFSEGSDESDDSDGIILQRFNWSTFPTGSRKTSQLETPLDTTENGEHEVESDVVRFIATANLSTPAGDFSTLHLRETRIDSDSSLSSGNDASSSNEVTDYWFATSTGFFVKVIDNETENGNPEPQSGTILFKYEPK